MIGSHFSYLSGDQVRLMQDKVLDLLAHHGVKLDEHPQMFDRLAAAGALVDTDSKLVRFPRSVMLQLLEQAPRNFALGARGEDRVLPLPRPQGGFYARPGTGAHGWIDPETDTYRKVIRADLAQWTRLVNHLDDISFIPFLYSDDVPVETADLHGLRTLLINTDKHAWVQPYSAETIPYLLQMAEVAAGGAEALKSNPLISMIACSLTPRVFKHMDIEIIYRSAQAGVPIHACSLPGAGGTSPATIPGTIILAVAEILAMVAMAQAVVPGTPVVACPIVFATDMRTGRSLQSSVQALRGASGAVQFIKAALNLPTHNYGSGSDAAHIGWQSQTERSMLSTLMTLSGADILGGAGQMEVATAVSPIQLIIDNAFFAMARHLSADLVLNEEQLAWQTLIETEPGQHFLTSQHTFKHCRDGYVSDLFISHTREEWDQAEQKRLKQRALARYQNLMTKDNTVRMNEAMAGEIERILSAAEAQLCG